MRAALATDLFGLAAHELAALTADGDPLETRFADFEHYHTLWRLHGFIHMFRRLVAECGIAARLRGFSDGDRRLTNLFHLAELVHCARLYGMEAEIAWLAARRRDAGPSEDAELRIEGDEGLVQIVTIHLSKGLEYPVTFVPFLWDDKSRAARGDTYLYHDPEDDDRPVLDLGICAAQRGRDPGARGGAGRAAAPRLCGPDARAQPLLPVFRPDPRGRGVAARLAPVRHGRGPFARRSGHRG